MTAVSVWGLYGAVDGAAYELSLHVVSDTRAKACIDSLGLRRCKKRPNLSKVGLPLKLILIHHWYRHARTDRGHTVQREAKRDTRFLLRASKRACLYKGRTQYTGTYRNRQTTQKEA